MDCHIIYTRIFVSLFIVFSLAAGETPVVPSFEHIGAEQGLSHNSGLCIIQDHRGFIWVGTQNGLNRYDGYTFKKYFHNPNDSTSLSDSYINSLYEDSEGTIWVGTNKGGLNRYDRFRDKFTCYRNHPEDPHSLGEGAVYAIAEDVEGNLWVGINPAGLYYFDRQNEKFYHIQPELDSPDGFRGERVYTLYTDHRGTLWIGSDAGLSQLLEETPAGKKYLSTATHSSNSNMDNSAEYKNFHFRHWSNEPNNPNSLVSNMVHSIYEQVVEDGQILWIGTWDGLSQLRLNQEGEATFINYRHDPDNPFSLSGNRVWSISQDGNDQLWIGTFGEGLNYFDRGTRRFYRYKNNSDNSNGFTGNTVRSVLQDAGGIMWFGTESSGLYCLLQMERQFKTYRHHPGDPRSLSNNDVSALWEDPSGDLWVGTKHGGVNLLKTGDHSEGKFTHFRHDPAKPRSLLHDRIRAIYRDGKDVLWIASWDARGGLNQFDPVSGDFHHFQHNPSNPASLADNQVKAIAEDSLGNLWFGTSETGLERFNREAQIFHHFPHNPDDLNSISDNAVIHLLTDRQGIMWISTFSGGLSRFDPRTQQFTRFLPDPATPNSISHNRVWSVYEDHLGRLWIGTDGGLNLFNRSSEQFFHFTEKDGLCNNSVYGILEDNNGNLWLSTQKGLAMCKLFPADVTVPESVHFINFDVKDGLPDNEFNSGAFLRSGNGELFFGSVNGLLHFFPDRIKENRNLPPVVITGFKIFEKDVALDSAVTEKKRIELSYKDNFFSLEFSALDFREPEKNRYAYQLEGFNKDWIYSGNRRYVTFSHLDPGKYIFRVRASNGANIWNKEGASLSIIIRPPYWMTTWFRLLVGTMFLIGIVWAVRQIATIELRKRLREMEMHQNLQNERNRISGELHDHIGANLTDLATGLEIAKRYLGRGKLPDTEENLDFLEKHTRNTIEELRETIWSLGHKTSTIEEFCEKMKEYIHKRTRLTGAPEICLQENVENSMIFTPEQSLNLFRICQEAVNNSLKHACAKKIEITVEVKQHAGLRICIKDDGTGFNVRALKEDEEGFGLTNMNRRAQRIGAKLVISSSANVGTNIEVCFPG